MELFDYVIPIIQFRHTVNEFQVLVFNTNNSIQHFSFVNIQLNCFKYCYVSVTIQFGHGSKGNEGVLHIIQNSRTEASPLNGLKSYPRHSFEGVTSLQRCSQHILQPQPTELFRKKKGKKWVGSYLYQSCFIILQVQKSVMQCT